MSYKVFLVASAGLPRDHHAIFVETNEDGAKSGYLYQVSGTIQEGMIYSHKKTRRPEESNTFSSKTLIGTVTPGNYPRIRSFLRSNHPAEKAI